MKRNLKLSILMRRLSFLAGAVLLTTGFADCGEVYGKFKYKVQGCKDEEVVKLPLDELKENNLVIYKEAKQLICPGVQNFVLHYNKGQGIRKEIAIPIYAAVNKCELHVVTAFANAGVKKKRNGIVEGGERFANDFAKLIFAKTAYKAQLPVLETDTAITDEELKEWCKEIQ